MSDPIPATMKAIIIQEDHTVAVKDVPIPEIGDDEVLVKNVAVSLNGTDWKLVAFPSFGQVGAILGYDVSGKIVKVGKGVTHRKVGDRVAACVHSGLFKDRGALAEYAKVNADLMWSIPENTTFEEASSISCGAYTVIQPLFHPKRLGLEGPTDEVVERNEWIFVYGGSTSCGLYAIQLIRAAGYKVVTVSSPRNFALLTSLGANAVFDYNDPEVVQKIKGVSGDSITRALDCISSKQSQKISQDIIAPGGGKVQLLFMKEEIEGERADVDRSFTLVLTSFGKALDVAGMSFPESLEDKAQMANFIKKLPRLIEQGRLKPNPLKIWDGGLDSVQEGLKFMQEGKVSGEKIVLRL